MIRRLALVLAAGLPLMAMAQTPPAASTPAPSGVTVDVGGWAVLNSYFNSGGTNAVDLPQRAAGARSEIAAGMQVRQSRVRANLGLPGGGLLGDAKLKGLVELDFMGGPAGGGTDQSLPLVRLRHYWVSANWADLGNLTLTLGQTWGIYTGPYFAASLGHLAVPRFAGAGFLFRRAPQARLSGDVGGEIGVQWAAALMAPMDKVNSASPPVASTASVGERSGLLDAEARVAVVYRPEKKNMVEVGVSAHYGQDRYVVGTAAAPLNKTIPAQGLAVDAKVDVAMVTVLGGAYAGQNLDIYSTIAPGVKTGTVTGGIPLTADAVHDQGFWGQLQVNAIPGLLQVVAGGGMETPKVKDLAVSAAVVRRNGQLSGGVIVNLAPKWKCSVEYTNYVTTYNDAAASRYVANQAEISTLYAF